MVQQTKMLHEFAVQPHYTQKCKHWWASSLRILRHAEENHWAWELFWESL